jgi:hypothetical protein
MSALVPKMSALTPIADIHPLIANVRFGPEADIGLSKSRTALCKEGPLRVAYAAASPTEKPPPGGLPISNQMLRSGDCLRLPFLPLGRKTYTNE